MTFSWYTRVLLALASGLALALAFPNYNLPLLAWVSIALLILASYGARPRVAPLYGFLHGLVFYPICLPWIDVVMQQYGDVDPWTSAGILGLIGIAGGIICAFFSWGVALASRKGAAFACALAPFLWVALEFARAQSSDLRFPLESDRLRRERQSRACPADVAHGNLRAELPRRRVRRAAGLRDSFRAAARVEGAHRRRPAALISDRGRRALLCAQRDAALRGAPGADGFCAVV